MRKRLLAMVVSLTLLIAMMPATVFAVDDGEESGIRLQNPINDNGVVTWDCVYFGNYPQSDATGVKKDPIKWRILEVTDTNDDGIVDDAFLLADMGLDCQRYHFEEANVTWQTCALRGWLNGVNSGDFMSTAFDPDDQAAINETTVINSSTSGGGAGGNDTQDKVFLLSSKEVNNAGYGFVSQKTRKAKNTAYAKSREAFTDNNGYARWWLRSPGKDNAHAIVVGENGFADSYGYYVNNSDDAIRPALHLNLQSSCWSYAGVVDSQGVPVKKSRHEKYFSWFHFSKVDMSHIFEDFIFSKVDISDIFYPLAFSKVDTSPECACFRRF